MKPYRDRGSARERLTRRWVMTAVAAIVVPGGLGIAAPTGTANAFPNFPLSCSGEDGPENLGPGIFQVREFSLQKTGLKTNTGDDLILLTVDVIAKMSQSDAQRFIDRPGHEAIMRVWGDDVSSDDLIAEFRPEHYFATPDGLVMRGGAQALGSSVNEDSFPEEGDEWYAGIRLTDLRDGAEKKVETCMIRWDWIGPIP